MHSRYIKQQTNVIVHIIVLIDDVDSNKTLLYWVKNNRCLLSLIYCGCALMYLLRAIVTIFFFCCWVISVIIQTHYVLDIQVEAC